MGGANRFARGIMSSHDEFLSDPTLDCEGSGKFWALPCYAVKVATAIPCIGFHVVFHAAKGGGDVVLNGF